MNQHCGKHDKVFNDDNPCPGCVTEQEKLAAEVAHELPSVAVPTTTEEVVKNLLKGFEASLRKALGK